MKKPVHMFILHKYIPHDIWETYYLDDNAALTRYIYIEIKNGMYALKLAAILAVNTFVENVSLVL